MISKEAAEFKSTLQKECVDQSLSIVKERRAWDADSETLPIPNCISTEMMTIGGRRCLRLEPKGCAARASILFAHGGGLTTGSIITHRQLAAHIAIAAECDVYLPDYRLLPEHAPEAPHEDIWLVFCHLIERNDLPILLGGDSSGACLALNAAKRAAEGNFDRAAGCFSISGAFDATLSSESHIRRSSHDPILSLPVLSHWQKQLGQKVDLQGPLLSPLNQVFRAMPPLLLLAGSDEVWLDDSKRLATLLDAAQLPCTLSIYEGMWHVWPMATDLPESRQAFEEISRFAFECIASMS